MVIEEVDDERPSMDVSLVAKLLGRGCSRDLNSLETLCSEMLVTRFEQHNISKSYLLFF